MTHSRFPSPAENYLEGKLNLNEQFIPRPSSTFLVRAEGDSMTGIGIYEGDLLIVDKSLTPVHNHIVVAILNEEFTVRRFLCLQRGVVLFPENKKYKPIPVTQEMNFQVWGVVTYSIHGYLKQATR